MKVFLNERLVINGNEWMPKSVIEFNSNINSLLDTLESFLFLTEIDVLYSSIELKALLENIGDIQELSDYSITNPVQRMRSMLNEIEALDWSNQKKQKQDHIYYFISGLGATTYNVNGTSLAEACEYRSEGNEVALLNFISSEFNESNPLNILRGNVNPPKNVDNYPLAFVSDTLECILFYHAKRRRRVYNWNPKHGENGRGMIHNGKEISSPLECDKNRAAIFLEVAVGYRKSNELYNFDDINSKFMVWKCDSRDQNSFHAYHPIDQDEVEDEVKKFIQRT